MGELWDPIIKGAAAGLLLAVLIGGPVFVGLLKISIEKGFMIGLLFAMGVIISDASYFVLSYLGISQLNNSKLVEEILGAGGGAFMTIFGARLVVVKEELPKDVDAKVVQGSLFKSMMSGFLINSLNPAALLFWIATVSTVTVEFSGNTKQIFAFFIVSMSFVFGTDVLKAFLAGKVKNLVTPKFMLWLHRISGVVLIAIGLEKLGAAILRFFNIHLMG
jgi:threonine/homoserine/homoserine lactone efflux protein